MKEELQNPMQELMDVPIWFLVKISKKADGTLSKVPFSAFGGKTGTNNAHSATWVTYQEAMAAKEKFHAESIGFKIPEGYFFEDIDHKPVSSSYVQMMLKRYASYAESSVSGNDIHIYGKVDMDKLPAYMNDKGQTKLDRQFYMKNPHIGTELYMGGLTNRFACYTGNVIFDAPLKDCTQAVLTTLDKDMRRKLNLIK